MIIDSNDREVIIDSNDAAGREAIGTWPPPEIGEQDANSGGENPPPTNGMDPIPPSDQVANVAAVTGKSNQDDMNFSKEMEGAKPGELHGFKSEDGSATFGFNGDGITSTTEVFKSHHSRRKPR